MKTFCYIAFLISVIFVGAIATTWISKELHSNDIEAKPAAVIDLSDMKTKHATTVGEWPAPSGYGSIKELTLEAGVHHIQNELIENAKIHLKANAKVVLGRYTDIDNSYIRVDENAQFIVESPHVAITQNKFTGSSTAPVIVTHFIDGESDKPLLAWNRFEHFDQRQIDRVKWEANIVDLWGFPSSGNAL